MKNKDYIDELQDVMENQVWLDPHTIGTITKEQKVLPFMTKKAQKKYLALYDCKSQILETNDHIGEDHNGDPMYQRNIYQCSYYGQKYDSSTTNVEAYKDFGKRLSKIFDKYTVMAKLSPILYMKLASDGDPDVRYMNSQPVEGVGKDRRMLLAYLFIKEFPKGAQKSDPPGGFFNEYNALL